MEVYPIAGDEWCENGNEPLGYIQMREISYLPEELLDSDEGPCFMELDVYIVYGIKQSVLSCMDSWLFTCCVILSGRMVCYKALQHFCIKMY